MLVSDIPGLRSRSGQRKPVLSRLRQWVWAVADRPRTLISLCRWAGAGLWIPAILLLWIGSSYADTTAVWHEDFEGGSLEGWVTTTECRMNHRISLELEGRDHGLCLKIEGDVEDKINTDSRVVLRYDFAANGMPLVVAGDSMVLQFE